MGLKSKAELFHKYFLTSQVALLLVFGASAMHNKFHQDISGEESAQNEAARYPALDLLIMKLTGFPQSLFNSEPSDPTNSTD